MNIQEKKQILMTSEEVCKMLRISARSMQTYRDRRIIPFIQISRKIYYKLEDIEEYLSRHYVKAAYQKMEGGAS
jgi:DNA-binding transcriptional MerR regulator